VRLTVIPLPAGTGKPCLIIIDQCTDQEATDMAQLVSYPPDSEKLPTFADDLNVSIIITNHTIEVRNPKDTP
jgi:hypothetical protein